MNRVAIALIVGFLLSPLALEAAPVAQEAGYDLDYSLDLTANHAAGHAGNSLVYSVNNSALIPNGSFGRVAYELTLSGSTNPASPNGNVWVSFNTQSNNASLLGVPTTGSGEFYQQGVSNMNVIATAGTGVTNATGLTNGNIQFWPSNYGTNPATGNYDWNNTGGNTGGGYGALQISQITNTSGSTGNMFISFNQWSSSSNYDVGPGNNTGNSNPDYTFRGNIGDYTSAALTVWVTPEPSTFILGGLGLVGLLVAARRRKA